MSEPRSGPRPTPRKRVPINRERLLPPAEPEIDPTRPVHIAIAEPVTAFHSEDDDVEARWEMPIGIEAGDTVITLAEAREWAVARVSVWTVSAGTGQLHHVDPELPEGASLTAAEKRVRVDVPRSPGTLLARDGAALLAAIRAEADAPTPWRELDDACDRANGDEATRMARLWGCRGCGRDTSRRFAPRFETHVVTLSPDDWPSEESRVVGVCPSCHDILHQPLGPTIGELMFSNRPPCPKCGKYQAFTILRGFPPGPPPHGTVLHGCDITNVNRSRWVCGACDAEW